MPTVEHSAAGDPGTDLAELARLAYVHPELRAVVAANPSAYVGLLDWLGQLGDPAVDAALAARVPPPVEPAPAPAPPPPSARRDAAWREPTRDLVLHWGNYPLRYGLALGLLLVAVGVPFALILYTLFPDNNVVNNVANSFLMAVPALAGIVIMPATVGRRITAGALAALVSVLMVVVSYLFGFGMGPGYTFAFAGVVANLLLGGVTPLLVWLILRARSGLAYVLVIASMLLSFGFWLLPLYGSDPLSVGLAVLVPTGILVGLAWAARGITRLREPRLARRTQAQR